MYCFAVKCTDTAARSVKRAEYKAAEQEIKEVCKDALYQKIREDMRKLNVNDIIANISYKDGDGNG